MKKLISSVAALALVAGTASAGGLEEPVVQAVEGVEEDRSSAGWIIPLVAIGLVALAISGDDDNDDDDDEEEVSELSDIRLKHNIERVGTADNGLPLYRWQYFWSSKTYEGVMAQDVLAAFPEAVVRRWHGFFAVNYSKLGLRMVEIEA